MTVIRVGAAPEPFAQSALFMDGISARLVSVDLRIDESRGELVWIHDGSVFRWPLTQIRELPDQSDATPFVLRLRDDALKRLYLPDRALAPRLPNRTKRTPTAKRGRLAAWALAAIASVALIIFVLVPNMANQLAPLIPPKGERALGEATLNQIREALDGTGRHRVGLCENPPGRDVLDNLATTLTEASGRDTPISLTVLDHPMVNAFALPGGYIVMMGGLIDAAQTPEQLASVLAHEIGHVVSRDPTRHALQSAGSIGVLGLLFGDFAGGTLVLFLANQLINAQYSQTAEATADAFAHALMIEAGLPPSALGEMFQIFGAEDGDDDGLVNHFMSHPALGDRIEAARKATPKGFVPARLMTDQAWDDVKSICSRR